MSAPGATVIRISRFGWFCFTVIVLLPWGVVLWRGKPPSNIAASTAAPAPTKPSAAVQTEKSRTGAWGRFETSRIFIEPPEDFIPSYFTTPQPLRWTFPGYNAAKLDALWEHAGLTKAQREALSAPAHRTIGPDAVVVTPSPDIVLGLSPESRAQIYAVLALAPENIPQRDPFRARMETVDDWFNDTDLPSEIIALTRKLLYRREASLLFADADLVLPKLRSPSDRVVFVKTLSRKTALLVQLHVDHNANVDELTRYWGQGRRSKDVRPLLQSLAHQPQGGSIDVVHLLPPFARSLLYTYPVPSGKASDSNRDCHWTSLNFYNEKPDDRLADLEFTTKTILENYYLTGNEPALGDIIMLVEPSGRGVHSCVYIADDIVFTKNGAAFSVPWLLGRLDTIVAFYSMNQPLEVRRYRARDR